MSGVVKEEEKEVKAFVIPEEVEKIVISTDTLKAILKEKYGRDIESIEKDRELELWTIDFLTLKEAEKKEKVGA